LSKIASGRRRTSIDRVKACWPAISRYPNVDCVDCPNRGMHAPRSGSGDRSSRPCERPPEMKKAAVVSQGGFKRTIETFVL
jgi:hypothetical protein